MNKAQCKDSTILSLSLTRDLSTLRQVVQGALSQRQTQMDRQPERPSLSGSTADLRQLLKKSN